MQSVYTLIATWRPSVRKFRHCARFARSLRRFQVFVSGHVSGLMIDRLGLRSASLSPAGCKLPAFPKNPKEFEDPMIMKFASITVAVVFGLSLCALAQTDQAATTPNAPSATTTAATAAAPKITGTKVGALAIEQAIFTSNEGRRDIEALGKKFEPKQTELKGLADEIDSLKKQLSAQQDKLNDDAREKLLKQIETKQKSFEHAQQDAQEDFQNQQQEIAGKILTKMEPVIVKYVSDNGYGLLLDSSQPWPRGLVILAGPAMDITQQIVDAYNAQSGVAAPAASAAPKPAAKTTPAKPAAPASTAPKK
jgi:outer membrane protein